MKTFLSLILGTFVVFAAYAQEQTATQPGPQITFEEKTFDFGDIQQGDQVEHIFAFENTGDAPLILTNVQTTCGCTVPKWPREPIPPGQKSQILVKFNSTGKMGKINKVVKVISNANTPISQVIITTNILPKTKDIE